eukprot:CAMPEP_0201488010 /NCGR_PEP_ID=MMETSP0151_2-20130828/16487_1 /ASSEMBLY_ACC=CAM_ASM_000257 /TAXON_ID=200890 /ORGANISM="Paramoeba atlantica, Strain 621/1 / CCAP 1560/9" /LENGTH=173 /DNA_ID=CAMNT_0047873209 /DNA_START=25 /DNA_END=546 /DNA_ORIENTATION=-
MASGHSGQQEEELYLICHERTSLYVGVSEDGEIELCENGSAFAIRKSERGGISFWCHSNGKYLSFQRSGVVKCDQLTNQSWESFSGVPKYNKLVKKTFHITCNAGGSMRINDRNQVKHSMVKAGSSFYLVPTDKVSETLKRLESDFLDSSPGNFFARVYDLCVGCFERRVEAV